MNDQESKPTSDHDLLVTLSERVKNGFEVLTTQIKDLKDGVHVQLADHERRIHSTETINDKINPLGLRTDVDALKQEIRDFKTSVNVFRIISGIIGGGIVFVLTQVPAWLRSWGVFK